MNKRHTLGKHERLKSRKAIKAIFNNGKKIVAGPLMLYYHLSREPETAPSPPLQMGVSASTKNYRKAVDRNRIKRLIREAYRTENGSLKQLLAQSQQRFHLFFIYTGRGPAELTVITEKMKVILEQLETLAIKK